MFLALLLVGVTVVPDSSADAAQSWFDTSDRQAVLDAYHAEFDPATPDIGWTGSRSSCSPGTTSQAYRDSIFSRINWYRSMAGVPAGVTENTTQSAAAQQAALMNAENGMISHSVSPSVFTKCYTSAAAAVAGQSNLYLGRVGPHAISGYVFDPGSSNTPVGHRNWILHPTATQMGTGDIPNTGGWSSNVLWVFDQVFAAQPALRESEGFVAWPPRGYIPGPEVPQRWSFSLRGANFGSANVTVTRGGVPVDTTVVHRSTATNSAPFPIIVWQPTGVDNSPAIDEVYTVTISGYVVNGVTKTTTYNTVIIGDQPGSGYQTPSQAHGAYIDQAYQDFLGRNATASEINYWSTALNSGTSRFDFVSTLSTSDEWVGLVVDELYVNTLGRPAEAEGKAYWSARLSGGLSVAELASAFYGSQEYVNSQGGTYEPWVGEMYRVLLGREGESEGTIFWTQTATTTSTGQVAYEFYQSMENRRLRVRALYLQFLGREPDPGGLDWWSGVLVSGDDLELAAFLAASDEYVNRSAG